MGEDQKYVINEGTFLLSKLFFMMIISHEVTLKVGQKFSDQLCVGLEIFVFKTRYPRVWYA